MITDTKKNDLTFFLVIHFKDDASWWDSSDSLCLSGENVNVTSIPSVMVRRLMMLGGYDPLRDQEHVKGTRSTWAHI